MIDLTDDLSTTTVFSTQHTTNWKHGWADLSPWAGQTITLAMTAQTESGGTYTRAYLDEVSVGSSYPDLWANLNAHPRAVPPGNQVVYRVNFGNRGGVPASGVGITTTFPDGIFIVGTSPLTAKIEASSIRWNIGELPARSDSQAIVITATVAPTASAMSILISTININTISPELETANNSTSTTVCVGYQNYLPVIRR